MPQVMFLSCTFRVIIQRIIRDVITHQWKPVFQIRMGEVLTCLVLWLTVDLCKAGWRPAGGQAL